MSPDLIARATFGLLSPAGSRAGLQIFIFHRVLAEPDPLFPEEMHAQRFDELLRHLSAWFNILPLDEASRRLSDGTLPARAAALSFDDGYADNASVALPLLQKHGLPCSFFIATGFIGTGACMWNDLLIDAVRRCALPAIDGRGLADEGGRDLGILNLGDSPGQRRALIDSLIARVKYLPPDERLRLVTGLQQRAELSPPTDLMMTPGQLRQLRDAGMQLGAHTVTHPILSKLGEREAADEMRHSKEQLQAWIDRPVTLFAYPNGRPVQDYLPARDPGLVRELGFEAAVSTHWAVARAGCDRFQLPRFTPWDSTPWRIAGRLAHHLARR